MLKLKAWHGRRYAPSALQPFYQHFPLDLSAPVSETPLLALDLELTGLDPRKDCIVAIAAVPMLNHRIDLANGFDCHVAIDSSVGQSAVVHGLRDSDLQQGMPLQQALSQLLPLLSGRLLVCHHAPLDLSFLKAAFWQHYRWRLPLLSLDTLAIERRRFERQSQPLSNEALQLASCRHRYHLPNYPDHCAYTDAISCAELLSAQLAQIDPQRQLSAQAALNF